MEGWVIGLLIGLPFGWWLAGRRLKREPGLPVIKLNCPMPNVKLNRLPKETDEARHRRRHAEVMQFRESLAKREGRE